MGDSVHVFNVKMSCTGCSSAVEKVLGNVKEGIQKVEISLEDQKVYVTSSLPADQLLDVIKKTGKETEYVGLKK